MHVSVRALKVLSAPAACRPTQPCTETSYPPPSTTALLRAQPGHVRQHVWRDHVSTLPSGHHLPPALHTMHRMPGGVHARSHRHLVSGEHLTLSTPPATRRPIGNHSDTPSAPRVFAVDDGVQGCPAGTAAGERSAACTPCLVGYWSGGNASQCTACPSKPEHSTWDRSAGLQFAELWWPALWTRVTDSGGGGGNGSLISAFCGFSCDVGYVMTPQCVRPVLAAFTAAGGVAGLVVAGVLALSVSGVRETPTTAASRQPVRLGPRHGDGEFDRRHRSHGQRGGRRLLWPGALRPPPRAPTRSTRVEQLVHGMCLLRR